MEKKYQTYLIAVVIILTLFYSTLAGSEAEELGVKIERNVPVPMRDGTILRADVYRPDRGGPYPVLVQRTPYGKGGNFNRFVKAGYIVVSQDARGRYESEGKFESYWQLKTHDAEDGYDTVEWAAKLPGSTGKVGTFGTSYPAFLQWRLAPFRPPSLVAMSACSIPAQIWYVENPCTIRPGFRLEWLAMMAIDMRQHENLPGVHNRLEHWQLWQEESRKWLYWLPWLDLPQDFFGYETDIFKSWLKNPHTDPWKFDEGCKDITVPNLDIVGWYDHCNGDMLLFQMMVKEAKTKVARKGSRIVIGPWSHGGTGRRYRNIDFGPNAIIDKRALQIGWFDYWLKGKQNGGSKEAPVRIFVMGDNRWRDEQHWPLQRTKEKFLYITSDGHANTPNGNGRLIAEKTKSAGTDNYLYDPDNPVPTPYGARRPIPVDQRPLVKRQDILVYQTEPLTERVEVTGNPVVELYAASSAPDTDWFIRLIDVAPDGLARDASSGMVRARYRDGFDKFKLIEPNEVVKYIIRMSPTSNAFLPGHRIRLDITSSDFPNYDRNHNTPFNQNADATLVTAKQTIFHGSERATQIILPWVPNPQETEQIQPADLAKSLFRAAANGDIEQVKLLISMGADVNVKHSNGTTPAELAMNGNHNEVVELLISKGADISPLHFALYMKDQAKIKGLIESGADVNKRTPYGTTPLHRAVGAGFKDIVDLLIVKGADVNAKDSWDWTPLHSAVYDSKDTVELLITKGADVNARDGDGLTPLSYALATDRKDVAELLLVKGADFTSKDENARTPLHYAAQYGLKNIAEIFLARDVDVNSKEQEHGLTPLHYAASGGHQDIAELFMTKGAKVDEKDNVYEFTALHYAARFGHKDIAEFLIAKGADINAKDKWEYQPIHVAAHHDRADVVELLISKGADINAKTSLGQTPIQLAQERRNSKTVELLRKYSSDKNALRKVSHVVSDKPYIVLERDDVKAVIVNNEPVDDKVLPGHRGGYSGVASLRHRKCNKNLFVPLYAGLNFEHIHDGTVKPRDILFEPRQAPMQTRQVDKYTVELYQPPTPHWQLESRLRYQLLEDGVIEMTFECVPHARTFKNDYIGLFFASYIDQPESLDIHFLGHGVDKKNARPRWIRGVTPAHGQLSTHLAPDDSRNFAHDPDFPLTLVFNLSNYHYNEPWYYGVSQGMALVLMFRPSDDVRFSQSPSGGGKGNPAWDFQWFLPKYKIGHRYRFVMRAMYLPFESREQLIQATAPHRLALKR